MSLNRLSIEVLIKEYEAMFNNLVQYLEKINKNATDPIKGQPYLDKWYSESQIILGEVTEFVNQASLPIQCLLAVLSIPIGVANMALLVAGHILGICLLMASLPFMIGHCLLKNNNDNTLQKTLQANNNELDLELASDDDFNISVII